MLIRDADQDVSSKKANNKLLVRTDFCTHLSIMIYYLIDLAWALAVRRDTQGNQWNVQTCCTVCNQRVRRTDAMMRCHRRYACDCWLWLNVLRATGFDVLYSEFYLSTFLNMSELLFDHVWTETDRREPTTVCMSVMGRGTFNHKFSSVFSVNSEASPSTTAWKHCSHTMVKNSRYLSFPLSSRHSFHL